MANFILQSPEPDHIVRPSYDLDTLPALISRTTQRQPGHVAIQWRDKDQLKQITYSKLWARVESVARALLANGLNPQDHIAIWSENRWEWVVAYLAILRIGAVVIPLDSLQKAHEVRHILVEANVKLVFTSKKFYDNLAQIIESNSTPITIVSFDNDSEHPTLSDWLTKGMTGQIPLKANPQLDSLAVIIYTSGTTGFAKGVMLTHRNIASDIVGFYQVLDFGPPDIFLSVLPLHHSFECTVGMLAPLVAGCTVHYAKSLKSRDIIDDFKIGGITVMLGVPLLYEKLLTAIQKNIESQPWHKRTIIRVLMHGVKTVRKATGINLSSMAFRQLRLKAGMGKIHFMISGGAALPPSIAEAFNEFGFPLMQGYGMTETSPVISANTFDNTKHSSVGKAIPGVTLKIDNPDDQGMGEIMAKGDCVMAGYYRNEKATNEVIQDGWLTTGDKGWIDEEGFLTITGRVKDIIVTSGGKNINPEEVEIELDKSPFILESLVIAITAKSGVGEDLGALIVPNFEAIDRHAESTGVQLSPDDVEQLIRNEVRSQCRELPEYRRIKKIKLHMEEFQRTSIGKIKRYLYREHILTIPHED